VPIAGGHPGSAMVYGTYGLKVGTAVTDALRERRFEF
jgi:hypothetical protein